MYRMIKNTVNINNIIKIIILFLDIDNSTSKHESVFNYCKIIDLLS